MDDLYPKLPQEETTAAGDDLWGWCWDRHELELGDHAAIERTSRQSRTDNMSERWRAELRLNAARGMVRAGEARAGIESALETYTALPDGHRSATVKTLARRVVATLPEQARNLPAAREMRAEPHQRPKSHRREAKDPHHQPPPRWSRPARERGYCLELDERRGEVLDDLAGDHLGCGQVVGVLEETVLTRARVDAATTWPEGFNADLRRELGIEDVTGARSNTATAPEAPQPDIAPTSGPARPRGSR